MLRVPGIALVPASAPDFFTADTPTAVLVRQVLGAIAQFDQASTVASWRRRGSVGDRRLAGVRAARGLAELHPDAVALARRLRPKGGRRSLREISAELAAAGYVNERGRPFNPKSVASMLA